MKKKLKLVLITSLAMTIIIAGLVVFSYSIGSKQKAEEAKREQAELDILEKGIEKQNLEKEEVIPLFMSGDQKNVEKVTHPSVKQIYNPVYSENRKKQIEKTVRKGGYNFEQPYWEWNPFGTNNLSMYVAFKTTEDMYVRYTISVKDDEIPDFTRTLYNGEGGNLTQKHRYQLIGFIPGVENYIILNLYNAKGKLVSEKAYSVQIPSLKSNALKKLDLVIGDEYEKISNGLFVVSGKSTIGFYDNSGNIRSEIPIQSYGTDKMQFWEGDMIYSYDISHFAKIDRLGQVKKVYDLGNYQQHHDYLYNGYGQFWILATKKGKKTKSVEDTVISLDLSSGKVKELLNFETLLPEVKKASKKEKGKKTFGWISLNAIAQVGSDDIIVSSRELSTIIRINHITSLKPRITYLIADKSIWKKSKYKDLLYVKKGQAELDEQTAKEQEESLIGILPQKEIFPSQFGQSDIYYDKEDKLHLPVNTTQEDAVSEEEELTDEQYYLYVFDNDYGDWPTRKSFKWSKIEGIGTKKKAASASYIYQYLVDEKEGSYDLVGKFPIDYTKENGSIQIHYNNLVLNQGSLQKFAEYNAQGVMLRSFGYKNEVKRVFKEDMKEFWFH